MHTSNLPARPAAQPAAARQPWTTGFGVDIDSLIDDASDDELELALRHVSWNARDLGQFLKQQRAA